MKSELYEKLANYRDVYWKTFTYSCFAQSKYQRIESILLQLMNCAFSNLNNPDELPTKFLIKHIIGYDEVQLKKLLKTIGLNVEVKFIHSCAMGETFEVTLKKEEC